MSLSKRDMELMLLGYKCFESPPKVNFEKLASLAGLKNANSAQTCYSSAKRKFLSGAAAAATTVASLATSSTTIPNSSPSTPVSKKRKTSAKTTTSKPTKGKGGKASSSRAKGRSATNDDDDADDADDDAEDDEEPVPELDVNNVLAMISEENAASAADMQLKFDQDAHTVKRAAASTLDIADIHPVAKANAGQNDVEAKEAQLTTVVKAEARDEEDIKAKDLLRKAMRIAMNASLGDDAVAVERPADLVSSRNMVDLLEESGERAMESSTAAAASAQTGSGLMGGDGPEKADEI